MKLTLMQYRALNRQRLSRIADTVASTREPGRFFTHSTPRHITEVRLTNYALSEIIDALWGQK